MSINNNNNNQYIKYNDMENITADYFNFIKKYSHLLQFLKDIMRVASVCRIFGNYLAIKIK